MRQKRGHLVPLFRFAHPTNDADHEARPARDSHDSRLPKTRRESNHRKRDNKLMSAHFGAFIFPALAAWLRIVIGLVIVVLVVAGAALAVRAAISSSTRRADAIACPTPAAKQER